MRHKNVCNATNGHDIAKTIEIALLEMFAAVRER
jgi:hypothetical protein